MLASDGQPAGQLALELVSGHRTAGTFVGRTDARGAFELGGVAAGRFALALAGDPRVWLSAIDSRGDPMMFAFEPGGRVALGDFVLGTDVRITRISGQVVDATGRPISGAHVSVRGAATRYSPRGATLQTDASGFFTTAIASGGRYRIVVDVDTASGSTDRHSVGDLVASDQPRTLLLRPTR